MLCCLGGWRLHAETTGLIDMAVDTEEEVFAAIRRFLSYLPSHHNEAPPEAPVPAGSGAGMKDILSILPESRTQVYDMRCNTKESSTASQRSGTNATIRAHDRENDE